MVQVHKILCSKRVNPLKISIQNLFFLLCFFFFPKFLVEKYTNICAMRDGTNVIRDKNNFRDVIFFVNLFYSFNLFMPGYVNFLIIKLYFSSFNDDNNKRIKWKIYWWFELLFLHWAWVNFIIPVDPSIYWSEWSTHSNLANWNLGSISKLPPPFGDLSY